MKTIGNIIWLIFFGFLKSIGWIAAGLLCCLTIIGIPFGLQCFKIARLSLCPFGKTVASGKLEGTNFWGNMLWLLLGFPLGSLHLIAGILLCLTIVGIPFGIQCFKIAKLALLPFGAEIHEEDDSKKC